MAFPLGPKTAAKPRGDGPQYVDKDENGSPEPTRTYPAGRIVDGHEIITRHGRVVEVRPATNVSPVAFRVRECDRKGPFPTEGEGSSTIGLIDNGDIGGRPLPPIRMGDNYTLYFIRGLNMGETNCYTYRACTPGHLPSEGF